MRALKEKSDKAVLITYEQACQRYSLGMNTIQKLARTGNALVKIVRSARVDVEKMDAFVMSFRE